MKRFLTEYNFFTLSRLIGLGAKPLFIYILLRLGLDDFSNAYVMVITYVQFSLFFFNSEAQQRYYRVRFSEDVSSFIKAKEFLIYGRNCTTHLVFLLLPLVVFCLLVVDEVYVALAISVLAIAEKMFDECQRYMIYAKKYAIWSRIFLAKIFVPFFACSVEFLLHGSVTLITFLLSYFFTVLLAVITLKEFSYKAISFSFRSYLKYGILRTPFVLLFTLSSSNVLFLDRVIVSSRFESEVSSYVLACNIAVFVILAYDYFYLTRKKPELVNYSGSILRDLFGRRSVLPAMAPAIIGIGVLLLLPQAMLDHFFIERQTTVWILAAYAIYNVTLLLTVYGYWQLSHKYMSALELVSLGLFYTMSWLIDTPLGVAILMACYSMLRFGCYFFLVWRFDRQHG